MKEIKNKIKDSILGDFNQELIGDKVTLQNKVNKLQRMIDMINYLQPNEETEEFVLPEKWAVKIPVGKEKLFNDYMLNNKNLYNYYKEDWEIESKLFFVKPNESNYHSTTNPTCNGFTKITFKKFKKHVLNK